MATPIDEDVKDLRRGPRFILDQPIAATYEGQPVEIYNIGETGIQFEHRQRIHRGTFGELRFSLPISPRVIRLQGRVAWCRMARKEDALSVWPFRCGLRVEGLHALTIESLAEMLKARLLRPDRDSLERKRKLALSRPAEGRSEPPPPPPVTLEECITRVQIARAELRRDPGAARLAAAEGKTAWIGAGESDELIAVWQKLGRVIDPALIAVVFDLYPDGNGDR